MGSVDRAASLIPLWALGASPWLLLNDTDWRLASITLATCLLWYGTTAAHPWSPLPNRGKALWTKLQEQCAASAAALEWKQPASKLDITLRNHSAVLVGTSETHGVALLRAVLRLMLIASLVCLVHETIMPSHNRFEALRDRVRGTRMETPKAQADLSTATFEWYSDFNSTLHGLQTEYHEWRREFAADSFVVLSVSLIYRLAARARRTVQLGRPPSYSSWLEFLQRAARFLHMPDALLVSFGQVVLQCGEARPPAATQYAGQEEPDSSQSSVWPPFLLVTVPISLLLTLLSWACVWLCVAVYASSTLCGDEQAVLQASMKPYIELLAAREGKPHYLFPGELRKAEHECIFTPAVHGLFDMLTVFSDSDLLNVLLIPLALYCYNRFTESREKVAQARDRRFHQTVNFSLNHIEDNGVTSFRTLFELPLDKLLQGNRGLMDLVTEAAEQTRAPVFGLHWTRCAKGIKPAKPMDEDSIANQRLKRALAGGKMAFTPAEFYNLSLQHLDPESGIKVGEHWYKPDEHSVEDALYFFPLWRMTKSTAKTVNLLILNRLSEQGGFGLLAHDARMPCVSSKYAFALTCERSANESQHFQSKLRVMVIRRETLDLHRREMLLLRLREHLHAGVSQPSTAPQSFLSVVSATTSSALAQPLVDERGKTQTQRMATVRALATLIAKAREKEWSVGGEIILSVPAFVPDTNALVVAARRSARSPTRR